MNELSKETLEFIEQSKLKLKRKFDIDAYINAHEESGCNVPSIVVEFLKEFGGLKLVLPLSEDLDSSRMPSRHVHFDGLTIGDFCNDFKSLAKMVGVKTLYPIGELDGYSVLLLDEFGRMYYSLDSSEIYRFGTTIAEALNEIVTSRGNPK